MKFSANGMTNIVKQMEDAEPIMLSVKGLSRDGQLEIEFNQKLVVPKFC